MFYEEKLINNILMCRSTRDGEWYKVEKPPSDGAIYASIGNEDLKPKADKVMQDLLDSQEDLPADFAKAIDDNLSDLASTGRSVMIDGKRIDPKEFYNLTVPIKQSTIDETVECLEDYKHIALILNGVMTGVGAKFDSTEYERAPIQVDKLIKELKGE